MKRKEEIEKLKSAVTDRNWEACSEICFIILFGLPSEIQIGLACHIVNRYLSIFEHKYGNIKWPRELLSDPYRWVAQFGRSIPDSPDDINIADSSFLFCFDALVMACEYKDDSFTLTSSCVFAVTSAISAIKCNVWIADDPEGYKMWEQGKIYEGRTFTDNVAAKAVSSREWNEIITWLTEKKIWEYPDDIKVEEIQKLLTEWIEEYQMALLLPKSVRDEIPVPYEISDPSAFGPSAMFLADLRHHSGRLIGSPTVVPFGISLILLITFSSLSSDFFLPPPVFPIISESEGFSFFGSFIPSVIVVLGRPVISLILLIPP